MSDDAKTPRPTPSDQVLKYWAERLIIMVYLAQEQFDTVNTEYIQSTYIHTYLSQYSRLVAAPGPFLMISLRYQRTFGRLFLCVLYELVTTVEAKINSRVPLYGVTVLWYVLKTIRISRTKSPITNSVVIYIFAFRRRMARSSNGMYVVILGKVFVWNIQVFNTNLRNNY